MTDKPSIRKPVFKTLLLFGTFAGLAIIIFFYGKNKRITISNKINSEIPLKTEGIRFKIPLDETLPFLDNQISVDEVGTFSFTPSEIASLRTDVYKEEYFSIFDILVFHDDSGQIQTVMSILKNCKLT